MTFLVIRIKSPEEKLKEKRKELENVDEKELLETPKIKRQTMATDETGNYCDFVLIEYL